MKKSTMKITAILMFLFIGTIVLAQMPAAITIDPPDATAMDELTLTLSVPDACFESASLEGVDTVRFHGGVGFDDGSTWQFVIDWNLNGADGTLNALLPNGDGTYSMTFTPVEYFGVPDTNLAITKLCGVFNDGTWDKDGRDFENDTDCMDFFIPLEVATGFGENQKTSFKLYPNPVANILNIEKLDGANFIEIYNVVGTKVMTVDNIFNDAVKINTSELNTGVYFLNVHSQNGVQTAKLLKN